MKFETGQYHVTLSASLIVANMISWLWMLNHAKLENKFCLPVILNPKPNSHQPCLECNVVSGGNKFTNLGIQ